MAPNAHAYWDTSALTKVYVEETGSESARAWLESHAIAASHLLVIELRSAIRRRGDDGSLTAEQRNLALMQLADDRRNWTLLDVDQPTLSEAEGIVGALPVRALDAIHLATAVRLAGRWPDRLPFLTADRRQYEAALALGLVAELLA